jgi:hypothetical protein
MEEAPENGKEIFEFRTCQWNDRHYQTFLESLLYFKSASNVRLFRLLKKDMAVGGYSEICV